MILHAETALLPDGWARDVRLRIEDGRIAEVTTGVPGPGHGVILPAPVNLHSHMFQRAMAGMTEGRTAGQDSFWTWRTLMYRFLDRLTPEDVQAIAAQAMVEMAESGFAAVCEFHYLHHPVGGGIYADPAEMSGRIAAAAAETGLGLTHLPVIYEQGGVDGRALSGGQLRFGSSSDTYAAVLDGAGRALAGLPDAVQTAIKSVVQAGAGLIYVGKEENWGQEAFTASESMPRPAAGRLMRAASCTACCSGRCGRAMAAGLGPAGWPICARPSGKRGRRPGGGAFMRAARPGGWPRGRDRCVPSGPPAAA